MKVVTMFCDTSQASEERQVFYQKDAEAVLMNELSFTIDSHSRMRPFKMDQTDTVSTGYKKKANPMSTAYLLPVYRHIKLGILWSLNDSAFYQTFSWMIYNPLSKRSTHIPIRLLQASEETPLSRILSIS